VQARRKGASRDDKSGSQCRHDDQRALRLGEYPATMSEGPQRGQEQSTTGQRERDGHIGPELVQPRFQASEPVRAESQHLKLTIGAGDTANNHPAVDASFRKVMGADADRTAYLCCHRLGYARLPPTGDERPGFGQQLARSTVIFVVRSREPPAERGVKRVIRRCVYCMKHPWLTIRDCPVSAVT